MNRLQTKVLLVEDNDGDARLVQLRLGECCKDCYEIRIAKTLAEASQQLHSDRFDVALVDLSLPDSQGQNTLRKLRRGHPRLPIVVLTGLRDDATALDALSGGAQDYLVKGDVCGDSIDRSIRYAIERQQIIDENVNLVNDAITAAEQLKKQNTRLAELYDTAHQFVDNVSHEFRTPLTVIKEFASIVRDGLVGPVNDEQANCLSMVADRVDDLTYMVNDMLDTSRIKAGLMGVCRRKATVADIIEHIRPVLERKALANNIGLAVELDPNLPNVLCDPEKVGRIIVNLTVNALKFCNVKGQVRLGARPDEDPSLVRISVTDNGPGISEENLTGIFERFRQLDSSPAAQKQGFGLGLNIVRELVFLNLGEVTVESKLGEGSTFAFTIPVANSIALVRRYLRYVKNLRNGGSFGRLVFARIDDRVESALADEVNSLIQSNIYPSDLALHEEPHAWMLLLACNRTGVQKFHGRLIDAIAAANRNRVGTPLPTVDLEVRGDWHCGDEAEELFEKFANPQTRELVHA
ncbi:MAG: hybrid sensor histidine kinase/response regulator [Planctomycetes bacterium]|nr:hybrid sensor histidine kinase/response regulator [Planctomycetota bacterium]